MISRRAAVLSLLALAACGQAQTVYFSNLFAPTFDDGGIWRLGDTAPLISVGNGLRGLTVDAAGGKIYWAHDSAIAIANLDGSNPHDIVTDLAFPAVLAIDPTQHKLYWGDQVSDEIWSANLDGSAASPVITTPFHRGLAIDPTHHKMYWTTSITSTAGNIMISDLDGSNSQAIVTNVGKPASLGLDLQRGRLYWSDYVFGVVRYCDLSGGNRQLLYSDPFGFPTRGLAVDAATGDVYFGVDTEETGMVDNIVQSVGGEAIFQTVGTGLGSVISLSIPAASAPTCYPNCDNSTAAPILNVNDFICFQTRFAAGDSYANCDHSTTTPILNVNDFICFQTQFAAGCP
jgi:hypothetical protein